MICAACKNKSRFIPIYENITDKLFDAEGKYTIYKCNNCGILRLIPLPIDIPGLYNKKYSNRKINHQKKYNISNCARRIIYNKTKLFNYSNNDIINPSFRGKMYKNIFSNYLSNEIMNIKKVNNGLLLDFGCGQGEFISLMKNFGWRVEGVELDLNSVQNCIKKGLKVRHVSTNNMDLGNKLYDAVSMKHVIEHIEDFNSLLALIRNSLKKNGKVYITTPNSESLLHKVFKKNWFGLEVPRHLYIFNKSSIKVALENAGFENIEIKTTNRISKSIFYLSMHLGNNRYTNIYNSKPLMIEKIFATLVNIIIGFLSKFISGVGDELLIIGEKRE